MTTRCYSSFYICVLILMALVVSVEPAFGQKLRQDIQHALDLGDSSKAVSLLANEIRLDPAYHINYYTLGRIYYNRTQYSEALAQFEKALKKKKKHYQSLYFLGLSQLKLGELESAEKSMDKGLRKASKLKVWFENGYGLVKLAQGDFQEADRCFRRALAIEPDNAEYHINLGDANFYQGIPSLAIIEYEEALKVDTASLEVYYHWAEACLDMKDYNCAIEKLKIVLTKDSTHAPAWMRAGGIYYKAARSATTRNDRTKRFKDAIGSYQKYFQLSGAAADSSNYRAYFDMAMSYYGLRGYEDAVSYFEKVLAIPFEPRDIYFYYGKSLWGVRDYLKSGEVLLDHIEWAEAQNKDIYRSSVKEVELYKLLGDAFYYRKPRQFMSAMPWYTKSLEADPKQPRLLQNIAIAYHSNKSYAQAIDYYLKRIELGIDSTSFNFIKNAGLCALNLANAGADGEDIDIDEEEFDEQAADPDVDYYQLAIDLLARYISHQPDDAKVVSLLANTHLYQMASCTEGVKWFNRLLELEPGNCDAKKAIGFAYFGGLCTTNYSKALSILKDANKCLTEQKGACSDAELIMWIAQCYHLRGADKMTAKKDYNSDFKNAYNWYGKVLKCEPSNSIAKKGQDDLQFEFND
ncbi:MAG: tetratricopeptide repeat protein [candidate division Zixibacteria bacterium]|nr:tetratricopeptide repeat protein [candidate division Zixibacteria bacterium]